MQGTLAPASPVQTQLLLHPSCTPCLPAARPHLHDRTGALAHAAHTLDHLLPQRLLLPQVGVGDNHPGVAAPCRIVRRKLGIGREVGAAPAAVHLRLGESGLRRAGVLQGRTTDGRIGVKEVAV
eukprot:353304-Chlamydomonas_euryale.AAC.11